MRDIAALSLTGILTFTGVAAGAAANQVTANIATVDVDSVFEVFERETAHARPTTVIPPETYGANRALNILVLGVDDRDGNNSEFAVDDVEGARADTAMVLHISADRQHTALISIPRDSVVDIPSCPTSTPGRFTTAHANTRFNAAFAFGYDKGGDVQSGAICTLTTIESITNVRLDGFIVVDFAGFRGMVDALGGVPICLEQRISAPKAGGLLLEAGCQSLEGWQALQFMRARTGIGLGDGSDLTRIRRQQQLMENIAVEVLANNVLTDAPTLLRFLNATTSSMTASANFASVTGLASLAQSLGSIQLDGIDFIMVPIAGNPDDPNTVVWTRAAEELWRNVRYNTLYADEAGTTDNAVDGEVLDAGDVDGTTSGAPRLADVAAPADRG